MVKPREYPVVMCKVCKGIIQSIAPHDPKDISVHYHCGSKQAKEGKDDLLHVQSTCDP